MPPGTGDAQLTMVQRVPLTGAVVVSTPQDIALIDARKGYAMFEKTHVPVFGIVENMAYFISPGSGEKSYIFGEGGARRMAEKLGCDFLGEVPLHMSVRETSDAGTPIVAVSPDSEEARIFIAIAEKVAAHIDEALGRPRPQGAEDRDRKLNDPLFHLPLRGGQEIRPRISWVGVTAETAISPHRHCFAKTAIATTKIQRHPGASPG